MVGIPRRLSRAPLQKPAASTELDRSNVSAFALLRISSGERARECALLVSVLDVCVRARQQGAPLHLPQPTSAILLRPPPVVFVCSFARSRLKRIFSAGKRCNRAFLPPLPCKPQIRCPGCALCGTRNLLARTKKSTGQKGESDNERVRRCDAGPKARQARIRWPKSVRFFPLWARRVALTLFQQIDQEWAPHTLTHTHNPNRGPETVSPVPIDCPFAWTNFTFVHYCYYCTLILIPNNEFNGQKRKLLPMAKQEKH